MGSAFKPQILVEKLAKLNASQQSIETLSHWCIFHMNKARQVVETWDRQFHCSPREKRLAYLYLANDILQNSRRKGIEFVNEFWKVLPGALRYIAVNGDEAGKNAALRLVNIWDERKVFGSRGQTLKEEFLRRQSENGNQQHHGIKLKPQSRNVFDKVSSGYQAVYGSEVDEDTIFSKCRNAISFVEKVDKDIEGDNKLAELEGHNAILKDSIAKLSVVETSRANLVAVLREALQEQEHKLDQVRNQLQTARSRSEQAENYCRQANNIHGNGQPLINQNTDGVPSSVIYTRQIPTTTEKPEEYSKSAAAAMAEKLAASTSSAEMLTSVLSSLASSGMMNNPVKDSDFHPEKRVKIEKDQPYIPSIHIPHIPADESNRDESPPPPPPSSPPPPLPLPPPMQPPYQYMQTMQSGAYGYSMIQPPIAPIPSYSPVLPPIMNGGVSTFAPPTPVPPTNPYQSYQTDAGFFSTMPMAPLGRQ